MSTTVRVVYNSTEDIVDFQCESYNTNADNQLRLSGTAQGTLYIPLCNVKYIAVNPQDAAKPAA